MNKKKLIWVFVFLFSIFSFSYSQAAITIGNVATPVSGTAANPQITLTTVSSDTIIIVQVMTLGGQASSAVTETTDGAFTLANAAGNTGDPPRVETWYLLNPTAGSKVITVTNSGTQSILGAFALQGTRLASPIGNATGSTGASAAPATTINTLYANSWIVSVMGVDRDNVLTQDVSQTQRWSLAVGGGTKKSAEGTTELKTTPSLDTQSWSMPRIDNWAVSAVEIRPAVTPVWSNNVTSPSSPVVYSLPATYQFNVTWVFDSDKDNVSIEHNFTTASLQNYSITGQNGNIFYYDIENLSAGDYFWRMYANSTSGLRNQTLQYTFTVLKANSSVNLTLNNTDANVSIEAGKFIPINGTRDAGEGSIEILRDGVQIASGTTNADVQEQFIAPGYYNITLRHNATQNYTFSNDTLWVNVTDTINPFVNIISTTPDPAEFYEQNVTINWTALDYNLDTVIVNVTYPNGTLLSSFTSNFTLNTTNLSVLGNYNITIWANDTSGNSNLDSELVLVRDTTPPAYQNILEFPSDPNTFTEGQIYQFNITWLDNHSITSVVLVFDGVEYSDHTNISNTTFSKTFAGLAAGVHSYEWLANDSTNNPGSSGTQTYTVNRASSQINLSVNNVHTNITINEGASLTVNATLITPLTGTVYLYRNGVSIQSGIDEVINITTPVAGLYNYTAVYLQSQNYSATFETHWVRINAYPVVTLENPPPGFTDVDGELNLTCSATDAEGLQNLTLYHNISGTWQPNLTAGISGTSAEVQFNLTQVPEGSYVWNCLANDTYNATDFADANRSINVDFAANQDPIPSLISPAPNYWDNDGNIDFTCGATDLEGLSNATLYWNVTGAWLPNGTQDIFGTSNSTTFVRTNIPEGAYTWACLITDDADSTVFSNNRTFRVDTTNPNVSLSLPANNENYTDSIVSLNFSVTDNFDTLLSCNLTLDGLYNQTINAVNGSETAFNFALMPDGTHYWNVTCLDNAFNTNTSETRSFNVYTVMHPYAEIILAADEESIFLNWSNITKAEYYNIYISNNLSQGFGSTPNITGIYSLNYTDNNANSSFSRYYKIGAINQLAENITDFTLGKKGKTSLDQGFHLISLPFNNTQLINNGTNDGFTFAVQPRDCITAIYSWNGTQFLTTVNEGDQSYLPSIGSESFLNLNYVESYWLNTNSSCNITYVGIVPTQNITTELNYEMFMGAWHSVFQKSLGEEAVVGNPLYVSPSNRLLRLYRYNASSDLFEGTRHFSGYGWWPFFESQDFTKLDPGTGYYFSVNPSTNWTHDPTE